MTLLQLPAVTALLEAAPRELDLTRGEHLQAVDEGVARLLGDPALHGRLDPLELELIAAGDPVPLAAHLAVKIARSHRILAALAERGGGTHVSVVFAVYKEHQRILSAAEHPHGEDFLVRKVAQLRRLFDPVPAFSWDLTVVDDGCPQGSGRIAETIRGERLADEPVRVLFLEQAIAEGIAVTRPLTSAAESQKGGAIQYGMWSASRDRRDDDVVLFTDADLSTHLGQTGLLLESLIGERADGAADRMDAAIGSRREKTSVVVKKGVRNARGKLFIYLWKRMLPGLGSIVDTQCGFKAFRVGAIRPVLERMIDKRFAFDIELLCRTLMNRGDSVVRVPVAWIDSEAASTTTDIQPYLSMLKSVATLYRREIPANPEADSFAGLIEQMDEEAWGRLVDRLPEAITGRDPAEFDRFDEVRAADLADRAGV